MIKFDCSHCGRTIRAKNRHAGKKAQCPKCKQEIEVPQRSDFGADLFPAIRNGLKECKQARLKDWKKYGLALPLFFLLLICFLIWFETLGKPIVEELGRQIFTPLGLGLTTIVLAFVAYFILRSLKKPPDSLITIGSILLVLGALILGYYLFIFDTTVYKYGIERRIAPEFYSDRIYNVGLMNQQLVGSIAGGFLVVAGAVLLGLRLRKPFANNLP